MRETVIVIPCFNEAERLDVAAFGRFAATAEATRLLMVNDGSRDETRDVLDRLQSQYPAVCDVLDLGRNCGKAEAVRRGILRALAGQPSYVGYWDADLATPLDLIPEFCRVLQRRPEIDLVIGTRLPLLGHKIQRRPIRRVLGRLFAKVASRLLRLPIYDTQCGAKLLRVTPHTENLFESRFEARWVFDVEIMARMSQGSSVGGARLLADSLYELPLESWRDVPGSKLKARDFLVAIVELFRIYRRYPIKAPASTTDHRVPVTVTPPPVDPKARKPRRAA